MDKKLKKLKILYDNIHIPDTLDKTIDDAVKRERDNRVIFMKKYDLNLYKKIGTIAATFILGLGLTVNSSYALAKEIYKMPVVGEFAKIITLREYKINNDTSVADIKIPVIKNIKNEKVQNQINNTINDKVSELIKEQDKLDKEYKKAYLETGGTEEEYRKIEMTLDFELLYASEDTLSFEIYKYQTLAPAYNETFLYNINLKTGDNISIKEVLGENFKEIIKENVLKEMDESLKKDPNLSYDTEEFKNMDIKEDIKFFINEFSEVVVYFGKYEVAPGYMGEQEFVVGKLK